MAILFKREGTFVFGGTKHKDKELEEVAREDPGYLNWLWNNVDMLGNLTDEATSALQDAMEREGIPFEKQKGRIR
jgi:hypothetical protein